MLSVENAAVVKTELTRSRCATRSARLGRPIALLALLGLLSATLVALLFARQAGAAIAPNDTRYPEQWSLTKIRAHEAWGVTRGSAGVKVALLDSGVGYGTTIADLQGQMGTGYNTFTGGTSVPDDLGSYGSGTTNAGIIGARTNNNRDIAGINWNVTILPVKVCDWSGACPADQLAKGIDWAIAQNAQIIQVTPTLTATTPALNAAVSRAVSSGRLVVATVASPGTGIGYPGLLPGVITVGATNQNDAVTTWSAGGSALDIVAPGESIMALVSGGCCMARTSGGAAAAHVSGALALLLAAGVPASSATSHLYAGAKNIGPGGWDAASGWGRLDVCKALSNAGRACPAPAPTPAAGCNDVNGDTWIDLADVILTMNEFGAVGHNHPADVTNDGSVDLSDATTLVACIG
jgi:subtilisin family serine protease